MAAGLLLRRPAGMKNGGAFTRRETGHFQFLECRCGHGGNSRPMLDHVWREPARFADFPVGGVVFELELKQFQRERIKFRFLAGSARCADRTPQRGVPTLDELAQARGEV